MFDDLRKEADSVYESEKAPAKPVLKAAAPKSPRRSKKILGMTGPQRFAISFMIMLMVGALGFTFLLIMGKIGF
jgi:hypothetical protein